MNGVYLHLLLNHIPILGSIFALCLVLYGIFFKNQTILKAGLVTLVVSALISIAVFLSGEEAEHVVEKIAGVSEATLEHHEEEAEVAFWTMLMTGAIALGALLSSLKSKVVSVPLQWITLVALAVTVFLMARAGSSGGEIRHTEIQTADQQPAPANNVGEDDD